MNTVLTIDFDIVMADEIELYNDKITSQNTVDDLANIYPCLKNLKINMEIYLKLTKWLINYLKEHGNANIHFITSHDETLSFLSNQNNYVINIDHHHDLGYIQSDFTTLGVKKCSNWVLYGLKNKTINKYKWIKNKNSSLKTFEEKVFLSQFDIDLSDNIIDTELKNLKDINCVIICLSSPWVPKNIRPYFEIWKEIVFDWGSNDAVR